ncbi:MAG: recombinase RecT [Candidatus Omnitrophota bacterium]|jgi:recombination protein RecT
MGEKKETKDMTIRELISSDTYKRQFAMALPKHLKAERFVRIALTAITRTPKLANCTQASLVSCLLDLSQLGLEPDGRKAHLIPYGDKCTLIIDYKGLVDLARRSGEIADIHADVVCDKDLFDYSFGTDGKLVHKPALNKRGKPIAAYSFVRLKDGSSSYEVMSLDEIEAIHKRSKAAKEGPWITDWNEMAKKTVFRRHSKWLPVSSELWQKAIEKDADTPIDINPDDVHVEQPGKPEVKQPESIEHKPEPITPAQKKTLEDLAKKAGDEKTFEILTALKVNSIDELSTEQAKEAIEKLTKVAFGKK